MKELSTALIACALAFAAHAPAAHAATETVVHSFGSGTDGVEPYAALVNVKGTLYGTTAFGGTGSCSAIGPGCGTVFSLDPGTGSETVRYSFQNNDTDGQNPFAGLIDVKGRLYGTTYAGGTADSGTVFSFNLKKGGETPLFSFQNGGHPYASVINVDGTLYGTTYGSGTGVYGSVYSFDLATGTETVLNAFSGGAGGGSPNGGLIEVDGIYYGTTSEGGSEGGGTVFSFDAKNGVTTILHSFGDGNDGKTPRAGLIYSGGKLYGTTYAGGAYGEGTVFMVKAKTPGEKVLHSFGSGTDGQFPYAALIDVNGALYGTTYGGGSDGYGTVFSVDPDTDAETVLHSFAGAPDGAYPFGGLIDVKETLYGTTFNGGTHNDYGTVFSVVP